MKQKKQNTDVESQGQEQKYNEFKEKITSMSGKELIEYMRDKNRSDCYILIRDIVTKKQINEMQVCEDKKLYQEFQEIKRESKASFDYDNKLASMKDVNAACTNVYGIMLKLLKAGRDETCERTTYVDTMLQGICDAINRIEKHVGLPETKLEQSDEVCDESQPHQCDCNGACDHCKCDKTENKEKDNDD